jgi:hypothetical protein
MKSRYVYTNHTNHILRKAHGFHDERARKKSLACHNRTVKTIGFTQKHHAQKSADGGTFLSMLFLSITNSFYCTEKTSCNLSPAWSVMNLAGKS